MLSPFEAFVPAERSLRSVSLAHLYKSYILWWKCRILKSNPRPHKKSHVLPINLCYLLCPLIPSGFFVHTDWIWHEARYYRKFLSDKGWKWICAYWLTRPSFLSSVFKSTGWHYWPEESQVPDSRTSESQACWQFERFVAGSSESRLAFQIIDDDA